MLEFVAVRYGISPLRIDDTMTMDQIGLRYFMAHKDKVAELKSLAAILLGGQ